MGNELLTRDVVVLAYKAFEGDMRGKTLLQKRIYFLSVILGIINWEFFFLFFTLAVFYGVFLSVAAILLEELSFRRYPGWLDLTKLVVFGILENFGYRQILSLSKMQAFWQFLRNRRGWGDMKRGGFRKRGPSPAPTP